MSLIEIAVSILALEAVVLALIILLWAVTHFRDQLIKLGWLKHRWWIVRMATAADINRVWSILREMGFREDHFQAVARSLDSLRANKQYPSSNQLLSQRLLVELKQWTVQLDDKFSYKNSGQYYVDTMGAMSFAGTDVPRLASFLDEWVVALEKDGIIPSFDIALILKEGNVTLARQFLMRSSPEGCRLGIVCKGANDKSRVQRDLPIPHETDFEGLRGVFIADRPSQRPWTVIAVDDNCTEGESLCHAMRTFNELIQIKNYPIAPVKHAVVLFAVKSEKTGENFSRHAFELHAVLSLGRNELAEIQRCPERELKKVDITTFKQGFGCKSSLALRA